MFGLPFVVEPGDYEEDMSLPLEPKKLAMFLAHGKAAAVAKRHKRGLVIGADTFVVMKDGLMGKPKSRAEAARMLRRVSGKRVQVLTGFTIIDAASGKSACGYDSTWVSFKKMSGREISAYVASGEPMGKAGAFAVQGRGAVLIRKIEGDFMGALGLPLYAIARKLKSFGLTVL